MKLVSNTGKEVQVKNCKRPKMGQSRGSTWDIVGYINIGDAETKVYADTTWGRNGYFEFNGKWYSIPVWDIDYVYYCTFERGSAKDNQSEKIRIR